MAKPRRRVQFLMETSLGRGTVGFAQKPQFLHFRREETDVSDFEDKIPQAVVPRNPIPGLACKKDKSSSTQVDRGDGQQQNQRG